jgi:hypothetical protein
MKYCICISFYLLVLCKEVKNISVECPDINYSFFVGGHVYGTSGRTQHGIYPLFGINSMKLRMTIP